jgi:hypothetical protein
MAKTWIKTKNKETIYKLSDMIYQMKMRFLNRVATLK